MMSQRQEFIAKFFNEVSALDYILLKFIEGDVRNIDRHSDLDILVDKKTLPFILSVINHSVHLKSKEVVNRAFMTQVFIYFNDGSFLQIDCLFEFVRKNLIYLSKEDIREKTQNINGIKTYNDACLFEHLVLFNQLNNAGLPKKYVQYYESFPKEELAILLARFNKKYKTETTLKDLKTHDPVLKMKLEYFLSRQAFNSASRKLTNTFYYLKDTFFNLSSRRGKVITFSGVDGAGKSTILAETRELLETKYRKKVIVLRHRPSLLPILSSIKHGKKGAEQRAADKLPRQGTNKSSLSSSLRFAYYYLDYFIGQWYIFFRYQMFNYIVLYDRYYFDFIVDGRRSNIQLGSGLTKSLYRFVHKPELNIFLYAPSQVILKRKKELTAQDIESLTTNYQDLFANFSDKYDQTYLPIKNIDKEATLDQIQNEIQQIL